MSKTEEEVPQKTTRRRNKIGARGKPPDRAAEMYQAIEQGALEQRQERENFKNEILVSLASFRDEISKKIEDRESQGRLSRLSKNPLVLIIVGFILTGIAGAWITLSFQSREWNRQQAIQGSEWNKQQIRLVQIREIDQKYGIIDEVTKAVVEHDSAAMDAVTTFTWKKTDQRRLDEAPERLKHWEQTSKEWRVTSQKLLQKLIIHFKNPRVQLIFEAVVERRRLIANDIIDLRRDYDSGKLDEAEFIKRVYAANDSINKATSDLRELVDMMVIGIQPDLQSPVQQ